MLKPKHTFSLHVKKARTNAGELKRKSVVDKQFKLKLSNIYSKKLSKFNLEKQLNTIRKRKHANYYENNSSDSNSSDKYESTTTQKLVTQQKKTEESNKNGIKHS